MNKLKLIGLTCIQLINRAWSLPHNISNAAKQRLQRVKPGRPAVALGLETLDLARIHGHALATLELSDTKNVVRKLAGRKIGGL
ncbi:MAG: hypothetical protein ABSH48_20340 [Verrucomicrobiota bacterium]|jgi:hypothetical protein